MKPPRTSTNPNQKKWHESPGIIYFIGAGNPTIAIKIGVANAAALHRRFRQHQTSNHETLELLGVIQFADTLAAEARERELHIQFSSLQRFEPGYIGSEWFTMSESLLDFVSNHTEPPEAVGLPRIIARPLPRV